uniref:LIM zinc-binding domain-containing protein n=1 Tax=Panagrolaimus superbus TaxID=310955 RepID=A0A914Z362_9BILA
MNHFYDLKDQLIKICTACFCKLDDHDIPKFDHKGCDIVICSLFGSKHHHNHFISENDSTLRHASRDWSTLDGSESNSSVQTALGPEIPFETVFRRDSSTTTATTSTGAENARSIAYSWEPPIILAKNNNTIMKEEQTQTIPSAIIVDVNKNEEAKRNFNQLISNAKEKHFGIAKAIQCNFPSIDLRQQQHQKLPSDSDNQQLQQQHVQHSIDVEEYQSRIKTTDKQSCEKCGDQLKSGEIGIVTPHGKDKEIFHQDCFRCSDCDKLLNDLLYFFKDSKYLCGRHFGDSHFPRCSACDELILTREYTEANGQAFHNDHFCCSRCDVPLGGMKYVQVENEQLCFECHNKYFSHRCNTCKKMIQPDETKLSHKGTFFHNKLDCFRCSTCNIPLVNRKFIFKHEKTFCSYECKTNFGV